MQQDHKYTAADFERYHSGKMSESEMHALEKAALNDPFLAEALEGYAFTNSPGKDIEDIKRRLIAKKEEKKIVIIAKQNTWFRIAALFVMIAGIGYLAYQLNFSSQNNTLAKKGDSSEIKNIAEPVIPQTDSLLPDESKDIVAAPLANSKESLMNKEDRTESTDLSNSREKAIEKPAEYLRDVSMQRSAAPGVSKDQNLTEENLLRGKIVDTRGNPVSYATVMDRDKNIITTADSAGQFKMFLKDSALTATIASVGYKTKQKRLNYNRDETIVMENDSQNLNEVVTAAGTQRQRKESGYSAKLEGKASGIAVNQSTAEPVNGMQKFNEYVKKNIIVPVDEQGNSYKGTAVLSFEINKKGIPKKIKAEQSFCKPCNEEAIRLLKQGPKWKYVNSKRQFVSIQF